MNGRISLTKEQSGKWSYVPQIPSLLWHNGYISLPFFGRNKFDTGHDYTARYESNRLSRDIIDINKNLTFIPDR